MNVRGGGTAPFSSVSLLPLRQRRSRLPRHTLTRADPREEWTWATRATPSPSEAEWRERPQLG
eukprot:4094787-Alexandrium_andersonii.AAC.1